MDVKQEGEINRPCAVVWQLLFLLLEIVGGRLCPVEQVMTCVGKKTIENTHSTFRLVLPCVDAMLEE